MRPPLVLYVGYCCRVVGHQTYSLPDERAFQVLQTVQNCPHLQHVYVLLLLLLGPQAGIHLVQSV